MGNHLEAVVEAAMAWLSGDVWPAWMPVTDERYLVSQSGHARPLRQLGG